MQQPWYEDRMYRPVEPQPDSDELAKLGDRLMFRHDPAKSYLFVAPKGIVHSGWVVGVFNPPLTITMELRDE